MENSPLGTNFKSYELNKAINYYLLDPHQYQITKFTYNNDPVPELLGPPGTLNCKVPKIDNEGLVYRDVNFEKLIPAYTATSKSVNDFPAQSYHRFLANNGYFNPYEGIDNTDLWYYGTSGALSGAGLNVQETNHIILAEVQRGGLNTNNLAKYSSIKDSTCEFFNYNNNSRNDVSPYRFDSNYCRNIGINSPTSGTMP
uniref:Uncharacterized protein n=1 Tax=viral metagenome TaxID=1070528 RepID=A0A6C0I7Z8_9ZZZZ